MIAMLGNMPLSTTLALVVTLGIPVLPHPDAAHSSVSSITWIRTSRTGVTVVTHEVEHVPLASQDTAALRGIRSPAYSPDGRMVFAAQGALYVRMTPGGRARRISTGSAWHRDPTWTRDGNAIVFASDGEGNYELYRMPVSATGEAGARERLTTSSFDETMPTTAADGRIAFVRGRGASARVWLRATDGKESRVDTRDVASTSPAFSPDGNRLAYINIADGTRRVVVRTLATGTETTANADRGAERLAWAPDGTRLAISSRAGVWIVPVDGRYTNLASTHHGDVAWSADGRNIAVAEFDETSVAYNGDPDRRVDRSAAERVGANERLYVIAAPQAPDADANESTVAADMDRAARNAETFDRVWERSARLYFSSPDAADRKTRWVAARDRYRAAAIAAASDDELQRQIHLMLRDRPPLRASATGRAAVSSAHPVATAAGVEMLSRGGNVVDAAVATSFALGVVEPDASGVGGYGEMVIALKSQAPTLIEFMSRVPEKAGLDNTSLLQNGRYPSDGPVLANVPGTVAGMHAAWKKYGSGKLPWAELLQPAIRAAREGYVVSEGLATTLATEREAFAKYAGSRAVFFRNGEPMQAGDTLRNPDLAWTLDQIAKNGADGFYKGEVARRWIADIAPKGNAMQLSDLARYFAPEREPVRGTYRDYTIYSSAPPVSGGAELVGRLNLLERFSAPKRYTDDATSLHAALTAWFLVPTTRNRVADPSLWPVDIAPIVSKDTARVRWACFDANKALRPSDTRGDTLPCLTRAAAPGQRTTSSPGDELPTELAMNRARDIETCGVDHAREASACRAAGTTAFTVADNDGNAVAVTQTLGTWGGNFYVTPGLGFLSNDKLTSYGTDPTQYGARLPFARHGSTLAPTIAFRNGKPVFAVGAAGNAWITSAVYQTLLGALDYGLGAQEALELPRFLPGGGAGPPAGGTPPYTIQLEDGFAPEVIARLRELGYQLTFVSSRGELREGYGAAIRIDGKTVTAGADPRRAGVAGAVK